MKFNSFGDLSWTLKDKFCEKNKNSGKNLVLSKLCICFLSVFFLVYIANEFF